MDYKNNYLLAHIKRQMERELGINRPRVDRHISVKIDVEVYVEERKDLEDLKAALRKEHHKDLMNEHVYMLYVHGEPRKQISKHEVAFFDQGIPGFEVRTMTMREMKNQSYKKESKLRRAEWLCSKKNISFDEICELNEMQLHIHRYEDLSNSRIRTLNHSIEQVLNSFYKL
jgi:hypothetical protein